MARRIAQINITPEQQSDADYFTWLSNNLPEDRGYKFCIKKNVGKDGYELTRPDRLRKKHIEIPHQYISAELTPSFGCHGILVGDLYLCEVSLKRKRELRIKKMINKIMRSNNLTYGIHKDAENTVCIPEDIFSDVLKKVSGFNLHPNLTLVKGK